jgi:glycosyltransferase involved in cell wall biosynthesis
MEKISLYLCTYNVERTIEEVLDGVFKLNPAPDEVILINDGSTDRTLEIITNFKDKVKIFNLPNNKGISYGRNLAIKNSRNNIVAALDSDVVPDEKWLLNIYNAMILHKSQLCGGLLIEKFLKTNRYNYWRYIHLSHRFTEKNIPDLKSFLTGSNTILNKKAWKEVNGFDEQYKTNGEDIHFCIKLRTNNFKMSFDSSAFCYHLQNDNLKSLMNRSWRYYINGTGLKKPTYKRFLLRTIKHLKHCLINSIKDILNFRLNIIDINFRIFFNYVLMEYKSCKKGSVIF